MNHEETIKQIKKNYLRDGIIKNIECSVKEISTKTFFGSTDKKGYIVKISMSWLDDYSSTYINIEPWHDKDEVLSMIKLAKEKSVYKFADSLLPKLLIKENL